MVDHIKAQLAAAGVKVPKRASGPPPANEQPVRPILNSVAPTDAVEARFCHEITFTGKVPGNNGQGGLLRLHWSRRQKLLHDYEWVVAARRLAPIVGPVRLELERHSAGMPMDYDNLVSTGKLLIDALVRCKVLPDDKPAVIQERHYSQLSAKKGEQKTIIRLIPLL